MINSIEFAKIITGLSANFGAKIPDGLLEFWQDAFNEDNISLEQIRYAAGKILRKPTNRYGRMPAYDEFIEILQGGNKEDKALVIANNIIAHMRVQGARVPLQLNDLIAQHLMTIRWPYKSWASTVMESELKWWVKEFCKAYRSYSALEVPMEIAAPEAVKKLVNSIGK